MSSFLSDQPGFIPAPPPGERMTPAQLQAFFAGDVDGVLRDMVRLVALEAKHISLAAPVLETADV